MITPAKHPFLFSIPSQTQIAAGIVTVMAVCAGISAAGNIMTTLFVRETGGRELEEVDALSTVLSSTKNVVDNERTSILGSIKKQAAADDWVPVTAVPVAAAKPWSMMHWH